MNECNLMAYAAKATRVKLSIKNNYNDHFSDIFLGVMPLLG